MGLGAEIAQRYRVRNRKADALVCAFGLLSSVPFLYVCLLLADKNIKVTYVSSTTILNGCCSWLLVNLVGNVLCLPCATFVFSGSYILWRSATLYELGTCWRYGFGKAKTFRVFKQVLLFIQNISSILISQFSIHSFQE